MTVRTPALIELLSELDGRRPETFVEVVNVLRSTGDLPPSRRGLGARPVTVGNAVVLLLASLTGVAPSRCPRAVDVYGSLRPKRRGGVGAYVPVLNAVASCDTFGEALELLIERGGQLKADLLKVLRLLFPDVPEAHLFELSAITIEITVTCPLPSARLVMRAVNDVGIPQEAFVAEWQVDALRLNDGFYRDEIVTASADKHTRHTITERSIFALAELLRQAEPVTEAA